MVLLSFWISSPMTCWSSPDLTVTPSTHCVAMETRSLRHAVTESSESTRWVSQVFAPQGSEKFQGKSSVASAAAVCLHFLSLPHWDHVSAHYFKIVFHRRFRCLQESNFWAHGCSTIFVFKNLIVIYLLLSRHRTCHLKLKWHCK